MALVQPCDGEMKYMKPGILGRKIVELTIAPKKGYKQAEVCHL
jgi:hypothetical protein